MTHQELLYEGKKIFNFHPKEEFEGAEHILEAARINIRDNRIYETGAALFAEHLSRYVDQVVIHRFLELLDSEYEISSSFHGNGCEHGFKPAKSCPNKECNFAELQKLYEKLKEV